MKVILTQEEIEKAKKIASQWSIVKDKEYKIKWGQDRVKTPGDTTNGVYYEMAVAKALNIPYDGDIGKPGGFDVGGKYEVRGTEYRSGCLLLHPEDKTAPYILVIRNNFEFELVGWIMGEDGKKDQYWRKDVRYPCYFVPQSALQTMDSLQVGLDLDK